MYQWLVIGISGVTCGGKTSLTFRLRDLLNQHFQSHKPPVKVVTISQDDYFLKTDDPRHVLLPSLGHFNWDIPSAVDLSGMYEDSLKIIVDSSDTKGKQVAVAEISKQPLKAGSMLRGILLIEGFLVLNYRPTFSLCHLKYYVLLSRALCKARRNQRIYDPADVPGYFEQCIWPEHVKYRSEILGKGKIIDESDSLTMDEVKRCTEEEETLSSDTIESSAESVSITRSPFSVAQSACVESEKTAAIHVGKDVYSNKDFYMKVGGNVFPLTNFGAAGLGMVNNVSVLNGGVLDKETIAQLVFKDVVSEIENKGIVNADVPGVIVDE